MFDRAARSSGRDLVTCAKGIGCGSIGEAIIVRLYRFVVGEIVDIMVCKGPARWRALVGVV
jgi:hypothetical protein